MGPDFIILQNRSYNPRKDPNAIYRVKIDPALNKTYNLPTYRTEGPRKFRFFEFSKPQNL